MGTVLCGRLVGHCLSRSGRHTDNGSRRMSELVILGSTKLRFTCRSSCPVRFSFAGFSQSSPLPSGLAIEARRTFAQTDPGAYSL
jgi:hypothetical protein